MHSSPIHLALLVCLFFHPFATQDLRKGSSFIFKLEAQDLQKSRIFKKVPKMSFLWGREKSNPFRYIFFLNM